MRLYKDVYGTEVSFPGVGTPREGMVELKVIYGDIEPGEYLQDMGNARSFELMRTVDDDTRPPREVWDNESKRRTTVRIFFAHDDNVYRLVFSTREEAEELHKEFKPYLGMRMVPNVLEVPEDASELQKLTWTIAAALNQYDPEIDAHGDGTEIIDFINGYGVKTPM